MTKKIAILHLHCYPEFKFAVALFKFEFVIVTPNLSEAGLLPFYFQDQVDEDYLNHFEAGSFSW